MTTVAFTVPGKPVGKGRPRGRVKPGGKGVQIYTPEATVSFERQVGSIAMNHFPVPFRGAVGLTVVATFEMPASWSKKKRAQMRGRHHTQKPDTSNIFKAVEDGMNLIAYADDAQVAEQSCLKFWGDVAGTRVIVEELEPVTPA